MSVLLGEMPSIDGWLRREPFSVGVWSRRTRWTVALGVEEYAYVAAHAPDDAEEYLEEIEQHGELKGDHAKYFHGGFL